MPQSPVRRMLANQRFMPSRPPVNRTSLPTMYIAQVPRDIEKHRIRPEASTTCKL